MAITKEQLWDKFEQECKAAHYEALMRGDRKQADQIRDYFDERKYNMDSDIMEGLYGQALTTGVGMGQLGVSNGLVNASSTSSIYQNALLQQNQYTQAATQASGLMDFLPEFGVLYLHNKELPAEWAGAKITSFNRSVSRDNWHIQFESKWDKALVINLYLDIEEYNGKEINEMARTYMEALNQRRVG